MSGCLLNANMHIYRHFLRWHFRHREKILLLKTGLCSGGETNEVHMAWHIITRNNTSPAVSAPSASFALPTFPGFSGRKENVLLALQISFTMGWQFYTNVPAPAVVPLQ